MAKGDYGNVLKGMETLNGIWREKQVLFWKFVERVRREREGDLVRDENSGEGGGEWIGDREEEEGVSAEEVERLWGLKLRRDFPSSAAVVEVAGDGGEDGVDDADEEEESQRGRSSEVMLRSFPVARVTVEGQEEESEVVSLEERSILSAGEPLSSDASLLLAAQANARLDPNAVSFVLSSFLISDSWIGSGIVLIFLKTETVHPLPNTLYQPRQRLFTEHTQPTPPTKDPPRDPAQLFGCIEETTCACESNSKSNTTSFSRNSQSRNNPAT